jgi:hypothetical protein
MIALVDEAPAVHPFAVAVKLLPLLLTPTALVQVTFSAEPPPPAAGTSFE